MQQQKSNLSTTISVARRAASSFMRNDMTTHAAALSYSTLFAIFPFLLFLIALLGTLNIPQFFDWLLEQAETALPADAYTLVSDAIGQIQGQARGGVVSIGIVAALWAASSGIRALMKSLNVAFEVEESRAAWKRYVLSVIYTVGLAALFVSSAVLMLIGPQYMTRLAGAIGWGSEVVTIWNWLRWPVLALLLALIIGIVYYVAPNIEQAIRDIAPGAGVAVVGWLLASFGFSYYVNTFANYSATYGSLGGIIVLLLYFYLSSLILLFGAEINAEARRTRQHREPPTQIPTQAPTDAR